MRQVILLSLIPPDLSRSPAKLLSQYPQTYAVQVRFRQRYGRETRQYYDVLDG